VLPVMDVDLPSIIMMINQHVMQMRGQSSREYIIVLSFFSFSKKPPNEERSLLHF